MHRREEVRDKKSSYEIRVQPEVMALWLRMDALLVSRQVKKIRKQLDAMYAYGVSTGYLESFATGQEGTRKRIVDVLKLNKAKFEEFKKP